MYFRFSHCWKHLYIYPVTYPRALNCFNKMTLHSFKLKNPNQTCLASFDRTVCNYCTTRKIVKCSLQKWILSQNVARFKPIHLYLRREGGRQQETTEYLSPLIGTGPPPFFDLAKRIKNRNALERRMLENRWWTCTLMTEKVGTRKYNGGNLYLYSEDVSEY